VVSRCGAPDKDGDRVASCAGPERVPPPREHSDPGESWSADDRYELTDEDREWARRTVASLPPLTGPQRDILALLLSKRRRPGQASL
jgi:hypothetical protein